MVAFYIDKIDRGILTNKGTPWTIDDVPKLWNQKVRDVLAAREN